MTEPEEKTWTDAKAASFLKIKVDELPWAIGQGAGAAIVSRVPERLWDPEKLKKWLAMFGHFVGLSTRPKPLGSGGPRL